MQLTTRCVLAVYYTQGYTNNFPPNEFVLFLFFFFFSRVLALKSKPSVLASPTPYALPHPQAPRPALTPGLTVMYHTVVPRGYHLGPLYQVAKSSAVIYYPAYFTFAVITQPYQCTSWNC